DRPDLHPAPVPGEARDRPPRPGGRAAAVGGVGQPLLGHGDRHRDQRGLRDPLGADQDSQHQAADGLPGPRPPRPGRHRRPGRAAAAAGRGRGACLHALHLRHRLDHGPARRQGGGDRGVATTGAHRHPRRPRPADQEVEPSRKVEAEEM
ncbi:MAG: hypothetical protein AVDCRST_MAG60-2188, partial [uncultured Nocardioides sp.]